MGILSIIQCLPRNREWASAKLGWWWVLNAGLGEALWPFAFTLQWGGMWPSALLLLFIAITGAFLHARMGIGASPRADARKGPAPSASLLEIAVIHSGVSIVRRWWARLL